MVLNDMNKDLIERCKLLPPISTIDDCRKFYKIFFKQKLYDANYGSKDHKNYRHKPIEEFTLNEVLSSFTIIQREEHWESFNESVFERYLENKTFEKLYNRLRELCAI